MNTDTQLTSPVYDPREDLIPLGKKPLTTAYRKTANVSYLYQSLRLLCRRIHMDARKEKLNASYNFRRKLNFFFVRLSAAARH